MKDNNGTNGNGTLKAELQKRKEQIEARLAEIEKREKERSRREDTRLKILIGAGTLADCQLHPEGIAGLWALVKRSITSPRDRDFIEAALKDRGWLA